MTDGMTGRAAAHHYIEDRGVSVIPLALGSKDPNRRAWQKLRIGLDEVDRHFDDAPQNIGLLTGEASDWVVDVDLDSPETRAISPRFLPPTDARFGRASTPVSHLLYQSTGSVKSAKFQDPTKEATDARAMLLELRASNLHTLLPPSVHPSGEPIAWIADGVPAAVDPEVLRAACGKTAAAGLLARHWPGAGSRQDAALALGGGLLRAGWTEDEGTQFVLAVVEAAGDEEAEKRAASVAGTAATLAAGEPATGWPTLAELTDERVVAKAKQWLGIGETSESSNGATPGGSGGGRDPNQASRLLELARARGIELFHDDDDQTYVSFAQDGHLETWPVAAKGVRRFLAYLLYTEERRAASQQALAEAVATLDGEARFAGPERRVGVRVLDHDGAIYLDLGDPAWRVVAIVAGHWRIIPAAEAPVRFRRTRGLLPLPDPDSRGRIDALRPLVNVASDSDLMLLVGWLLACLYPRGARPLLQILGEQGSAKSTVGRLLRSLVDPNRVPLRTEPKDEGDLLISAMHAAVVMLDNLSEIPRRLSDALCRLATGGGLSKRELYTDSDEVVLEARRPVLITAITEVVTASDLLDRTMTITLPVIPADQRRTEAEMEALARDAHPKVLGALLNAVAFGLKELPTTVLDRKPRMADMATFVEACAPALGWEPGAFLDALEANRRRADAVAIEALPVGPALLAFFRDREAWEGTATQLLGLLAASVPDDVRKERDWPKRPNRFSNQLKRLAPNLRRAGLGYATDRAPGTGERVLVFAKDTSVWDRHHRHDRHGAHESDDAASSQSGTGSSHHRHAEPPDPVGFVPDEGGCDGCDDGDDGRADVGGEPTPRKCYACGGSTFTAHGMCLTCHPRATESGSEAAR